MADVLDPETIAHALQTRWLGQPVLVKEQTGSTNTDCVALARAGAPAGAVVIANWQSAGRGRRGRQWLAPPGSAVLLSAILRPRLAAEAVGRLGMAGALAVTDAVHLTAGVTASVKYPNDVLVAGRKLSGVLPEVHLTAGSIEWAVLGIGINVWRSAVPPELSASATSLEEHGDPPSRNALIAALLNSLEQRLSQAEKNPEALAADWRRRDVVLGRQVTIYFGGGPRDGLAVDVDANARLLLRRADGTEEWTAPGEASFSPRAIQDA